MKIPELFGRRQPVFSFEFFQPKTPEDMGTFKATVRDLKKLEPSFVTITYGAAGSARERSLETAGMIKTEIGLETAAHLTCISHTRAEILDLAKRIRVLGLENIVALRGDQPQGSAPIPVSQRELPYAADLVRLLRSLDHFALAVAGYPEGHPETPDRTLSLAHLKAKVDAGGDWIITQLFFDNEDYFDFVKRAWALGIRCPIVPGIMPVTSFAQTKKFTAMCGSRIPDAMRQDLERIADDKDAVINYGIDHALSQCQELLLKGAPGIHFYTLNKSHSTTTILSRLKGWM